MRALLVRPGPDFSVADVHRGWTKALQRLLGPTNVVDLNLDDRLTFYERVHVNVDGEWVRALDMHEAIRMAAKGVEVACYEFLPDVVIVTSGFFVPPELYGLMRARGHTVVLLCTESPYEDDRQLRQAEHVDLVLLNDPTNLEAFRQVNPQTYYFPHAYDPDVHHPGAPDPELAADFTFVGTGYPSRVAFLEQVDWSGIDVQLAGHWTLPETSPLAPFTLHEPGECIDNDDAADLYRAAKVSANLYRKEAERPELSTGWAVGPREVELAACGTFFLREPRGEGDELFPMLPTFTDPSGFESELRFWLARDDLRAKAASDARAAVVDRTFDASASRLLHLIERQRNH